MAVLPTKCTLPFDQFRNPVKINKSLLESTEKQSFANDASNEEEKRDNRETKEKTENLKGSYNEEKYNTNNNNRASELTLEQVDEQPKQPSSRKTSQSNEALEKEIDKKKLYEDIEEEIGLDNNNIEQQANDAIAQALKGCPIISDSEEEQEYNADDDPYFQ